jgi:hypothetical protein
MELVSCKSTKLWMNREDTPLLAPCVKSEIGAHDPVSESIVQTQGSELGDELGGNNSVEC